MKFLSIKQKSPYSGKRVYYKWIPSKNCSKFKPITQVYGVCFTKEGKILIVKDLRDWKLPGGTPEKNEIPEETLKREVFEEANVIFGDCHMIGVQEVEIEGKKIYQLRYVAVIDEVKKQTVDPATRRTMKRKFIKISEFKKYVKWGRIGEKILLAARKEYENWKEKDGKQNK